MQETRLVDLSWCLPVLPGPGPCAHRLLRDLWSAETAAAAASGDLSELFSVVDTGGLAVRLVGRQPVAAWQGQELYCPAWDEMGNRDPRGNHP